MMEIEEVTIRLCSYNELRDRAEEACRLEEEIEELKKKHDAEIHQLKEEGKIAVMVQSPFGRIFGGKPQILEIVGLDKVRSEIEQHIIDDEVEKAESRLIKELAEARVKVSDLEAEIEYLQNRSLWQRIVNVFKPSK